MKKVLVTVAMLLALFILMAFICNSLSSARRILSSTPVAITPAAVRPSAVDYSRIINDGITATKCSTERGYTTIGGSIKNNTSVTLTFVQIKVMLERADQVVDTDMTYAVGSEGLAPGETTQWEWMFGPDVIASDQCSARLLDYRIR